MQSRARGRCGPRIEAVSTARRGGRRRNAMRVKSNLARCGFSGLRVPETRPRTACADYRTLARLKPSATGELQPRATRPIARGARLQPCEQDLPATDVGSDADDEHR